jgi:indole-3-glycerol phosphate synthase
MTAHRPAPPDLLQTIVAGTRRAVAHRRTQVPLTDLERHAHTRQPRADLFRAALSRTDGVNVIAECKRRSPSRGVLRHDYDPARIARAYEAAGACAISVLTEPTFFDGALAHLEAVRDAVAIPVLRKDFVVDEYQLLEARAAGADAVLLIVAALTDDALRDLHARAADYGLAALVEVHEEAELVRALASGAQIVGVNNRNLRTLQVDTDVSEELARRMPGGVIAVSESGLRSGADIAALRSLGYRAFLVGERLMTACDPGEALRALVAAS